MLFPSYTFFAFFLVLLAFYFSPLSWRVKKVGLLVASYVFYGAWNPLFLPLIWISTLTDWFVGARIAAHDDRAARLRILLVSLAVNLGLLGFFKYGGFILDNAAAALTPLGWACRTPLPDIVLPVGISFYTFQTLSYSLDIYRGTGRPGRPFSITASM